LASAVPRIFVRKGVFPKSLVRMRELIVELTLKIRAM
jgi:hypothetical protein